MYPVTYLIPPVKKGDKPVILKLSEAQTSRLEEVAESVALRSGYFYGANEYILTGKEVGS